MAASFFVHGGTLGDLHASMGIQISGDVLPLAVSGTLSLILVTSIVILTEIKSVKEASPVVFASSPLHQPNSPPSHSR